MEGRVLGTLIRVRLLALLGMFTGKGRNKKKQSVMTSVLFALLFIYVGGVFAMMFGTMFSEMVVPFSMLGLDWFYFFMAISISFALMFVGSVFMTYSQIYDAKDNEMLLSMPIKPSYIIISRIIVLYIYNLVLELLVAVPAVYVYAMEIQMGAMMWVSFVGTVIALPFLATALSAFLGFIIAKVSGRMRNKTLITVLLSIAFFVVYIFLVSGMNNYVQALIVNGELIAGNIRSSVMPLYWMGEAISGGRPVMLLFTVSVSLLSFAVMYMLLSYSFISLTTTKTGLKKIKYVAKEMHQKSIMSALMGKEISHFFSSPTYLMNCGLGAIFNIIGAVAIVIEADKINSMLTLYEDIGAMLPAILAMGIGVMASMNIITAPSISLEGKTLWIVKHSPIRTIDILKAKLFVHFIFSVGSALVLSVAAAAVIDLTVVQRINLILFPVSTNIFCGIFGLICNLFLPKFDWLSETVAVKQSGSVFLTMFGMMAITIVPIVIFLATAESASGADAFVIVTGIIFFVMDALLYALLSSWGVKRFESL